MGINIIRGEIGSGRSTLCMEMIKSAHEKHPDEKCVMIVPNHYSYETERRFVREFGGTGINNIEVMTLRKLAVNLLDSASLNYITAAGRHMLIHKAVEKYCETSGADIDAYLLASMKKPGFTEVMSSLISEFKRYMIDPAALEAPADGTDNKGLREKLKAAARIYKSYTEYIASSEYTDSEDDNIRLAERILAGNEFGPRTRVWVDSFDELSPQQCRVIEAIAAKGAAVTISVCHSDTKPIYKKAADTERLAFDMAERFGMGEIIDTDAGFRGGKSDDIRFLLENWGEINKEYPECPANISLFTAGDVYSEVEKTACRITDLVREEGLRYRDIAILCGNTENYNHIIETVFDEYKIPYFTDSTVALADHPIAMQILSVFDIFENGWSYEAMFRYLKAGFIYSRREVNGKRALLPLDPSDVDLLENYVLKYGIAGEGIWTREEEWIGGDEILAAAFNGGGTDGDTKNESADSTDGDNKIDALRREAAKPLLKLREKTGGHKTAKQFAEALFEFMCDINLNSGLKSETRLMRGRGLVNEAEQFTKLWNLLLDALNQTTVALGDDETDFQTFGEYMRVGLSQCGIRTIPSGIDQVYIGNVEKCSAAKVRVMFVIGANDGTFPSGIPAEGFFSNADRNYLSAECGIEIAPDTKRKQDRQYFKVYRALCAVSERLYVSRPAQSAEGKALMPSAMIGDIERAFPKIKHIDDEEWNARNQSMYISTPEATIHRMLINKSARGKTPVNPVWEAAYEWYSQRDEWRDLVSLIDRAKWYMKPDVSLDAELAERLYEKKTFYSASRLNNYALCPYGYFLKYGIRAREREVWEISAADVGSYAHEVIRLFCETVEDGAETGEERLMKWKALTDVERDRLLDGIIDETRENILKSDSRDKERSAGIFKRTGKNIKNAAKTVHMALSHGKYARKGLEAEFMLPLNESVGIKGIIDRVDELSDDAETRIRIIDYKTGKTSFDVVNIASGIDMQMVIYAIAALGSAPANSRVTGMYYNRVRSDMLSMPLGTQKPDADAARADELKLDGVTFIRSDEDIYDMDEDMRDAKGSGFLNIVYNKNGTVKTKNTLRTDTEMLGLAEFVKEKIIETDRDIKSGKIDCSPYSESKDSTACGYCSYREICSFSNAPEARRKTMSAAEAWELMAEKGEKAKERENDKKLD